MSTTNPQPPLRIQLDPEVAAICGILATSTAKDAGSLLSLYVLHGLYHEAREADDGVTAWHMAEVLRTLVTPEYWDTFVRQHPELG